MGHYEEIVWFLDLHMDEYEEEVRSVRMLSDEPEIAAPHPFHIDEKGCLPRAHDHQVRKRRVASHRERDFVVALA
jgi:hypothetical protein